MTTTGTPTTRAPRVLAKAGAAALVAITVTAAVGVFVEGRAGVAGALTGGVIALVFFSLGALFLGFAVRISPQHAVLLALLTYTFQVVLAAAAFAVISDSGAVDSTLSAVWVAAGLIAATLGWMVGQIVATMTARIPVYDLDAGTDATSSATGPSVGPSAGEAGAR